MYTGIGNSGTARDAPSENVAGLDIMRPWESTGNEYLARNTLIVARNVDNMMRDGIILKSDAYRPVTSEPVPVLMHRTSCGKALIRNAFATEAAERVYAVVNQDTRG
jgi:predicted acyl esterase